MTAMPSPVALTAGDRHHGSHREDVPSAICARVLAGAAVVCVILDVLAA